MSESRTDKTFQMSTFIAPIGHGLGDLIVSLPAIQWLIASRERTVLVLRSPRQEGFAELIPGLFGAVREVDFRPADLAPGDRYVNLRQHPLQTDHVWGSPEFETKYPGYKIADIVRDISHDFGILADFENLTPLPFSRRADVEGKVIVIPGAGGTFKCWPSDRWLDIARLLHARGHNITVVGQPEQSQAVQELLDEGLDWTPTPTLRDALDVVSSARAVVSVDTGLMHLALQQNVPVAAMWINNPGSLNYLRTVRHCFPVVSPRCSPECVSEELDKHLNLVTEWTEWCGYDSWQCHAAPASRCMNNVSVDSVWQQALKALNMPQVAVTAGDKQA
jgi:hypothetical protein